MTGRLRVTGHGLGVGNLASWEAAAHGTYSLQHEQRVESVRRARSSLQPIERRWARHLSKSGASLVHLQCADGLDTLSFALDGYSVLTGIDFSPKMISLAEDLARHVGHGDVTFICADVLDSQPELSARADTVYTGKGAIMWIADLAAWARVISRLLRPGGAFLLWDLHPTYALFQGDRGAGLRWSGRDYFGGASPSRGWPNSYGAKGDNQPVKVERIWPIAEVVQALLNAGLTLEHIEEHAESYFPAFPVGDSARDRIPQTFSIVARLPKSGLGTC